MDRAETEVKLYTKEQVLELIKQISVYTTDLAKIGTILRDRHGVYSLAAYQIKLSKVVVYPIPYQLYVLMKKLIPLQRHVQTNSRDKHNRVKRDIFASYIQSVIRHYTRKNKLPATFNWTLAMNERLVGKYGH